MCLEPHSKQGQQVWLTPPHSHSPTTCLIDPGIWGAAVRGSLVTLRQAEAPGHPSSTRCGPAHRERAGVEAQPAPRGRDALPGELQRLRGQGTRRVRPEHAGMGSRPRALVLPGASLCQVPDQGAQRSLSLVVPWLLLGTWVKGSGGTECPGERASCKRCRGVRRGGCSLAPARSRGRLSQ